MSVIVTLFCKHKLNQKVYFKIKVPLIVLVYK